MFRIASILLALSYALIGEARNYYYAPLGPWGLESTVIHAKAMRNDSSLNKVQNASKKTKPKDPIEAEVEDDLERAEKAFFHAVEKIVRCSQFEMFLTHSIIFYMRECYCDKNCV